jgi:CBS domain-containing protein
MTTILKELLREKRLFFVKSGMKIFDVIKFMDLHNIGAVPVLGENNVLKGIFSERDLLRRCVAKGIDISSEIIDEVMTKEVIVIESSDTVEYAIRIMKQESIRHIPIIEGKSLVGMLSMRDLLLHDITKKEEKIDTLSAYIQYNG